MTRRERRPATTERANVRPLGSDADTEWDELTTALNDLGILHVAPGRLLGNSLVDDISTLFERLMTSRETRLQQASIFLLLTHPELAGAAREAIGHLHP